MNFWFFPLWFLFFTFLLFFQSASKVITFSQPPPPLHQASSTVIDLAQCYGMFKPILGDLNFKLFAVRIVFLLVLWVNKNMRLWWENKINRIFFKKFGTEFSQKNSKMLWKYLMSWYILCDAHKKSSLEQKLIGNWGLVGNLGAKICLNCRRACSLSRALW